MDGTVKWFNRDKGFGFIEGDDGEDYFVHHSALAEGVDLAENDKVTFEPAETDRGKQAQNVALATGEAKTEAPAEEPAETDEEEK